MSSPAVDIKTFLDSLGTLGSIRIGKMDVSPDVMGAVFEYGGQMVKGRFGIVGVGYEEPAFQVMFRGAPNDYEGPMSKSRIAWAALAAVQPSTITNYLKITPQQSPFPLAQDQNLRWEIICNYYILKEV